MRLILILFLGFFISACSGFILNKDTDEKVDGRWGYYNEFTIYSTRRDVFIVLNKNALDANIKLIQRPGGIVPGAIPKSTEDYFADIASAEKHAMEYGNNIIGVLKKDTKFRVVKLIKYSNWSLWFGFGEDYFVYGEIIDGECKRELFNISDISYGMDLDEYPVLNPFVVAKGCIDPKRKLEDFCGGEGIRHEGSTPNAR